MARLRRPESFEAVRAEGLFRTTTVPQILAKRGAIFIQGIPGLLGSGGFRPEKIPTKQEVLEAGSRIFASTSCAEHVDVFLSHRWGSARWAKYLALCLYLNMTAAVVCSVTTWLLATAALIFWAHGAGNLGGNLLLLPIVVYLPVAVFLLVFFFGQDAVHRFRPISMWLDRACIHQTDHEFKRRQIQALPVFVARSSSMLVLWDDEYFQRLWCQLELATFAKHGGAQQVQFLPLELSPWLLSDLLLNLLVTTGLNLLVNLVPQEIFTSSRTFSGILPRRLLESAFGPLVTVAVFIVICGTLLGIAAAIPWTIACRAKLRSHGLMLEQMACFDCRAAECAVESDRLLVEQQVQHFFRSSGYGKEVVPQLSSSTRSDEYSQTANLFEVRPRGSFSESEGTEMSWTMLDSMPYTQTDERALDAFNDYIRGPLRSAVMESVGDQLHVPYSMCLVASLPMIFYSATDILQCDAECVSYNGFNSFDNYLLPGMLSWLTISLLILPTFYPVFLRMLNRTFSVQSELLQLMLAALSGFLTFGYGYFCCGLVFGLVDVSFQQGLVGLMPLVVLLLVLALQLRCLFGTDRHTVAGRRPDLDGTYRALHAADDFSI
ncbi:unnamed protein product [Symbiodinium sp. CCMP2592]|nr:unnamed protein product [Symbiodinium sp. CCMP2592]